MPKEPELAPYVAKLMVQKKQTEPAVVGSQQDERYNTEGFRNKAKHVAGKVAMKLWNGVMGLLGSHGQKLKI